MKGTFVHLVFTSEPEAKEEFLGVFASLKDASDFIESEIAKHNEKVAPLKDYRFWTINTEIVR